VYGSRFRRITLPPDMDARRGLLGKGGFLAVTWTQNVRSSPVKRGVWVLENILARRRRSRRRTCRRSRTRRARTARR
jgi:hypothetical protein